MKKNCFTLLFGFFLVLLSVGLVTPGAHTFAATIQFSPHKTSFLAVCMNVTTSKNDPSFVVFFPFVADCPLESADSSQSGT